MEQTIYRGAIFDLDGTLVDSMGVWRQIDVDFLGKRGLSVPPDYLDAITPMGFEAAADYTIERFGFPENREEIIREWYDMAIYAYANTVPLKKGAMEYLQMLKEQNIKMAVATASDKQLVIPALTNNGVIDMFDNIKKVFRMYMIKRRNEWAFIRRNVLCLKIYWPEFREPVWEDTVR